MSDPDADALPAVESRHSGELLQLSRLLVGPPRFALLFLEYGERRYRDAIIQQLTAMGHPGVELPMQADWNSSGPLLDALAALPADCAAVHLLGLGEWLRLDEGTDRCRLLNHMREALGQAAARPLLLWLGPGELKLLALNAPDLWAWRRSVFNFSRPLGPRAEPLLPRLPFIERINLDRDLARQRMESIDRYLATNPEPSWAVASLWWERGQLCSQWGNRDQAMEDLNEAHRLFEQQNDLLTAAKVVAEMATIQWLRGEPETALKRLRDEVLPICATLGDRHSGAVTNTKIADILRDQGEVNAARELLEEQSSIFEEFGDLRACATTQINIADILQQQGELDQAHRLYEAQVPILEKSGDTLTTAITKRAVALILQRQGEFDKALDIYQTLLPLFEKLGHVREQAITLTRVASIHAQRGELDKALRIYEEQRPICKQLGERDFLAFIDEQITLLRRLQ
ncbi:MAG: tetratricopeptide repeat protein [Magnetococcus sp. MYC-9]